ncbi:MAG TPA: ATP-binding protein [Pyrinomonadaceae bacterium]
MTREQEKTDQPRAVTGKLRWLIAGRFFTAIVLLAVGAFLIKDSADDESWSNKLPVFLVVVLLTIIYFVGARLSRRVMLQARLQFAIDVFLVTWLVWTSDVIHSPYTALYIVIIAVASLFLGPRDAMVISIGCAAAFTGCALAVINGLGNHPSAAILKSSMSQSIQAVGIFDVAFLVVGLLSARLAERQSRSDVRLIAATQSLATLRALHERIVASIKSGVVTTDLQGRIYTFNAAAEEITGYSQSAVRGKDASIFFGALKERIEDSERATQLGRPSPRFEADCLTAEGMRLRLGFTIAPLSSEAGETTGTVITFQDLTQIRALEETSKRQDRLAAIGRMAASIAHEIRNPLAAMRGSIQMLRAEMEGESDQTELMEIILRESDRLNRIITDFLSYARPRSIVHAKVDVGDLVKQTFTLLRHSPELKISQAIVEDIPAQPLFAEADAEQMRQVLWNLTRNALQAMNNGGTLTAQVRNGAKGRIRITFSDTGRGMSPDQVEHLFEPFSSTTGGTGLGLSIVYQIIRDHGGTINVRSREGQGTTITVELPEAVRVDEHTLVEHDLIVN